MQSENHSGQEIGFLRHLFSIPQSKLLDHLLYCRYQTWLQGDPDALPAMSRGGLLMDPESQHVASAGVQTEISECQAEAGIQGMEDVTSNTTFEGVGDTGGSRQARGTVRNPVWLKHEVQGSLGVERPFTLWNPVFLLAWQLLQNKFKVVLQTKPWRLSRVI